MRILSILCFIVAGILLFSAANLIVVSGTQDMFFMFGTIIPSAACIGLGIMFNKFANKRKLSKEKEILRQQELI